MKNLTEALVQAETFTLRESNGRIHQTDRNELRKRLMSALASDLDGIMTKDGIVISLNHEYWGELFFKVSLKAMNLDYDLEGDVSDYQEKLAEDAAKTKKTTK